MKEGKEQSITELRNRYNPRVEECQELANKIEEKFNKLWAMIRRRSQRKKIGNAYMTRNRQNVSPKQKEKS